MAIPFILTPASVISNANYVINLLTGSLGRDSVAVLDQETLEQVFYGARPLRAYPVEKSRVAKYPLENGQSIADDSVIEPKLINLIVQVDAPDYSGAFQQIREAFEQKTLLIVQTKACAYQNMFIQMMPREESPDKFNVTTISITLEEAIFALEGGGTTSQTSVTYYKTEEPAAATSILRGLQSPLNAISSVLSAINAASVWGLR